MTKAAVFVAAAGAAISALLIALFHKFPMMPIPAAQEAMAVDNAFHTLLYLSIVIYSLVIAALAYTLMFWRAKPGDEQGDKFDRSRGRWLESAWIGLSLVITLGLAAMGSHELSAILGDDKADIDVQVNASQFSWEFFYPAQNEFASRLFLPVGKRARLTFKSADVIHSFWVPEFRVKQDAVPGLVTTLYLTPTRLGTYELRCAELCGAEHTEMLSFVDVVKPEDFEKQLEGETW